MLYGWSKEYVLGLSFDDLEVFYAEGKKADLKRRGYEIKETITQEDREAAWDLYYSGEEKEKLKKYMEKLK